MIGGIDALLKTSRDSIQSCAPSSTGPFGTGSADAKKSTHRGPALPGASSSAAWICGSSWAVVDIRLSIVITT